MDTTANSLQSPIKYRDTINYSEIQDPWAKLELLIKVKWFYQKNVECRIVTGYNLCINNPQSLVTMWVPCVINVRINIKLSDLLQNREGGICISREHRCSWWKSDWPVNAVSCGDEPVLGENGGTTCVLVVHVQGDLPGPTPLRCLTSSNYHGEVMLLSANSMLKKTVS